MDEIRKDELASRFREFLDEADDHSVPAESIDLFRLFAELTALKKEVQIESRQLKAALDGFQEVFALLEKNNRQLEEELRAGRRRGEEMLNAGRKSVFLDLLDIYDRLTAGLKAMRNLEPASFLFKWCGKERAALDAVKQGQEMTRRRVLDILAGYEVRPMTVMDRPFDPKIMRAVGRLWDKDRQPGTVVEEIKNGFWWGEAVLRLAEVKINQELGHI